MKFLFAKSRILLHSLVLLFFGGLAVSFFWFFISGQLSFIWDTREFGFINLNLVTRSFAEGNFPLWNPFNFSGYPFMGDIESGMFYPVNWLFSSFFGAIDFSELVYYFVFHFFLGAVFAYVLAYKLTKNIFASVIAGIVYAYSGYALGHISHLGQVVMYMWVPLIFWGYIKVFEEIAANMSSTSLSKNFNPHVRADGTLRLKFFCRLVSDTFAAIFLKYFYVLLAGLIFGMAILVGHSNTTIYVLLGLVILTIYEMVAQFFVAKKKIFKRVLFVGVSSFLTTVFAFMVAAISALPVFEFIGQSNRAELSYEQQSEGWSLKPKDLLGIFDPNYNHVLSEDLFGGNSGNLSNDVEKFKGSVDVTQNYFYIGLVALVFALFGLFAKQKYKWFWLIFGAISLLAAFGNYTPVNKWLFDYFPGFNKARMAVQIMGMCFLAASMMVAVGAKSLAEKFSDFFERRLQKIVLKRFILGFLAALILFLVSFDVFYYGFNKRFYSEKIAPEKVFDLPEELELISELKAGIGTGKIQSAGYESDPFRIADEKNQLMQNKWEYYRIENVWGNGGIKIKKYNDLFDRKDRSHWKIINSDLYDFLNVKYVFSDGEVLPPNHFQKVEFEGVNFYLNKKVLPRAYFVNDYFVETDEQKQLELVKAGKVDFQKEVLLEKEPVYYGSEEVKYALNLAKVRSVNTLVRRPNYLELFVKNQEDEILVLSEVDYDGWKLFVDGEEQEYLTANYVFRAVPLAAGEHQVEFKYEPKSFYVGAYISIFSVILFIMAGIILKINKLQ